MDFNLPIETLLTNGIFCVIFVWYLYNNEGRQEERYKELRQDFKEDKEKMYAVIEKQGAVMQLMTDKLENMDKDNRDMFQKLSTDIEDLKGHVKPNNL